MSEKNADLVKIRSWPIRHRLVTTKDLQHREATSLVPVHPELQCSKSKQSTLMRSKHTRNKHQSGRVMARSLGNAHLPRLSIADTFGCSIRMFGSVRPAAVFAEQRDYLFASRQPPSRMHNKNLERSPEKTGGTLVGKMGCVPTASPCQREQRFDSTCTGQISDNCTLQNGVYTFEKLHSLRIHA